MTTNHINPTLIKLVFWYVHTNQNHRALCCYAINYHRDTFLVLSMVEKAKAPEHKINYLYKSMMNLRSIMKMMMINTRIFIWMVLWNMAIFRSVLIVCICIQRCIWTIYIYFNNVTIITKCNKSNIMEIQLKTHKKLLSFVVTRMI